MRMLIIPIKVFSLAAWCLCLFAVSGGRCAAGAVTMRMETWENTDAAFAEFASVVGENQLRNLLSRNGVRLYDGNGVADVGALADGAAGVRGGSGRVAISGQPSVVSCYLGKVTPITRVGFYTFNIDARTNQDYEVRFADNSARPGEKPEFAGPADLTVGAQVIGPDRGGCHSWFEREDGSALVDRADWVQFRIWRTYNLKAGHRSRSADAESWTAGIELEVFGAPDDVIVLSAEERARREALRRAPREPPFEKKATWQATMQSAREAIVAWESHLDALLIGRGGVGFGPWHVLGPMREEEAIRALDSLRLIDFEATYGEAQQRWRRLEGLTDGKLHDVAGMVGAEAGDTLFLARPLTVEQPFGGRHPFTIGVGLEDGWVMLVPPGRRVGGRARPAHRNQYVLSITDRPGDYWLFSRLTVQEDGSAPLAVTPHASKGAPSAGDLSARIARRRGLWRRLRREFTDPVSVEQMDWEQWDSTWIRFRRLSMSRREYYLSDWAPGTPTVVTEQLDEAVTRRIAALEKDLGVMEAAIRLRVAPWLEAFVAAVAEAGPSASVAQARGRYYGICMVQEAVQVARRTASLRLAVLDQIRTFGQDYPEGESYLDRIARLQAAVDRLWPTILTGPAAALEALLDMRARIDEASGDMLLSNPLLDMEALLMARGGPRYASNWSGPNYLGNELVTLSPVRPDGDIQTIYKGGRISDFDLHFEGRKILFSDGRHLHEIQVDGTGLRRISRQDDPHVMHFDGCYLPNDRIAFVSTACEQAVPCTGQWYVGNLHLMDIDGSHERRVTFDQDHDWNPCVLNNGQVIFTRWEYADTPHYFTRLLFRMNPDGTGQMEYYGSNSYWPNAMYWPRPIPGHPTMVSCIVSGHHGVAREGQLMLLDPARGRHEAAGVVQQIPGRGRGVEPVIKDGLVSEEYPRFAAPYPLAQAGTHAGAGRYFLVNCKPRPWSSWGVYLVDVFDNITPLLMGPYCSPVPLRPRPRPPVIPDKVDLDRTSGFVYMQDVYRGPGLSGYPRGVVERLRVASHHYRYGGNGDTYASSYDGGWDVKRIHGTVAVHPDGSAFFEVPANTPLFVQPLDAEGKALQTMRSWFVVMPGETLSCVGCHEPQNSAPPSTYTDAARRRPISLTPWYGEARGFGFDQEVQPVLDVACAGCHNGSSRADGGALPDFRAKQLHEGYDGRYSPAYLALHPYVRRAGFEADYHMLSPGEFDASTSPLIQMLKKGHHGVALDPEQWERLYAWIDLNVPYAPTWRQSHRPPTDEQVERRAKYKKLHANLDDRDEVPHPAPPVAAFVPGAQPLRKPVEIPQVPGWPFSVEEALERQHALKLERLQLDLGEGVRMSFVPIPPGRFVAGDADGFADERPAEAVVERAFYVATTEVTNEQYAAFDPDHDSAYMDGRNKDRDTRGYPVNGPRQPVIRISWNQAAAFCEWLSRRTGYACRLPTEVEWEWACRAGSSSRWPFGDPATAGDKVANVADRSLQRWNWGRSEKQYDDGVRFSADVASFDPNPWGVHDMIGNVAEWTEGIYGNEARKPVRGGSWNDTFPYARSASRWGYPRWQPVYNVGFRVVLDPGKAVAMP